MSPRDELISGIAEALKRSLMSIVNGENADCYTSCHGLVNCFEWHGIPFWCQAYITVNAMLDDYVEMDVWNDVHGRWRDSQWLDGDAYDSPAAMAFCSVIFISHGTNVASEMKKEIAEAEEAILLSSTGPASNSQRSNSL